MSLEAGCWTQGRPRLVSFELTSLPALLPPQAFLLPTWWPSQCPLFPQCSTWVQLLKETSPPQVLRQFMRLTSYQTQY